VIVSTMQDDFQLTVSAILQHGRTVFRNSEVVTWQGDGARRVSFADLGANAERLASQSSQVPTHLDPLGRSVV